MNGLRQNSCAQLKRAKNSPLDKKETGFPIVSIARVKAELNGDFLVMLPVTRWRLQNPGCALGWLSSGLRLVFD